MPDLKLAASKTIDHSQRGQEAMLDARQRMAAAGGAQGIFCALSLNYCLPQENTVVSHIALAPTKASKIAKRVIWAQTLNIGN